jgi:hypothetical protein
MDGKKLVLLGILVIAAGAAFVYFDPLNLDLLGLKQNTVVAKPAATPHVPAPMAKSPVIVPKAAMVPIQPKASVSAPPTAPTATSTAPKAAAAPIEEPAGSTAAIPSDSPQMTIPTVAETVQAPQPPMKLSKENKTASKPVRPKNQDLRYCLDLETNEAIAKCAGE